MKRIKKFAAALLTAIMMMTMTVTAYAEGGAHSLTVNVKEGQDLNGQTINLYKLFDVTESKSGETTNYAYTVNKDTGYKDALVSVLSGTITKDSKDEDFAKAVLELGKDNETEVQNFANKFTAYALNNSLGTTATSSKITESKKSYEFTGLAAGYYLVYVTGGKEIQSSLVTVDDTTNTVNLKTEAPSITKTADKATAEIGQVVTYTVTGSIPDTTGYDQYQYIIHDELSKGLDFVNDVQGTTVTGKTVNVSVAFKEAGIIDTSTAPKTATLDTENNKKMSLDLSAWVKANQTTNKGKSFTVTYYAKVNKDAVVTNNNKASLEYGNNSSDTTTTTPSEAKTNTYPLDIKKINKKTSELLADAHFTLYRSDNQGTINKNDVVKVSAVAGKDGCYVVDPSSPTTEMVTIKNKIDEKGYNLHLNGLAAGTYYLEETKAPDGFNKLTDPIKIVIEKKGETYTITADGAEGNILTVQNSTGSLLPSTGGTGVIVFAGVAILLVFGVVVSFIRDKRKAC